jgi:GNAT superfamily N-acetyltransferase
VTATLSRSNEDSRAEFTVRRLGDPGTLRELLAPDRAYAAYAIAQLDPARFRQSEWLEAVGPGNAHGIVVHSNSGLGRALFADGDPRAVEVILSLHPGSRFTFGSLRPEHRLPAQRFFLLGRTSMMSRMVTSAEAFRPIDGPAIRLAATHIPEINRLYSLEGGPAYYRPAHLEDGVYCGVFENGRLVSIAGTHVVSDAEGVAVVGNVFTHPRYRGRGYGTAATGAVTTLLLQRCPLVVLTVEEGNDAALSVYKRLGYTHHCSLHESPLIRKEPLGVLSTTRRLLAGWRGRSAGNEVVTR